MEVKIKETTMVGMQANLICLHIKNLRLTLLKLLFQELKLPKEWLAVLKIITIKDNQIPNKDPIREEIIITTTFNRIILLG